MRRVFLLIALCGCASGGVPEGTPPRQPVVFEAAERGVLMGERPAASTTEVPVPPATVWAAVKKVYGDLEIPITVDNPPGHQFGNANFFRSRSIAGTAMEMLVDCGSGMTGPKAASYRIYISLLTDVRPDGKGGTTVQTTFLTAGQDIAAGGDRITCASTGRFERLVLGRIRAAVGLP
jgi:hypothetical protein